MTGDLTIRGSLVDITLDQAARRVRTVTVKPHDQSTPYVLSGAEAQELAELIARHVKST